MVAFKKNVRSRRSGKIDTEREDLVWGRVIKVNTRIWVAEVLIIAMFLKCAHEYLGRSLSATIACAAGGVGRGRVRGASPRGGSVNASSGVNGFGVGGRCT